MTLSWRGEGLDEDAVVAVGVERAYLAGSREPGAKPSINVREHRFPVRDRPWLMTPAEQSLFSVNNVLLWTVRSSRPEISLPLEAFLRHPTPSRHRVIMSRVPSQTRAVTIGHGAPYASLPFRVPQIFASAVRTVYSTLAIKFPQTVERTE